MPMLDLYAWPTPNAYKVSIMLEEIGRAYRVIPVDIQRGDQFKAEFLKISPNNKMPAIVDHDAPDGKPLAMFESGAILIYLAETSGKFMPKDLRGRYQVIQWLMFQMGGIGPMLGQAHHFRQYAPDKIDYAINRYTNEATRLYRVVDKRLGEAEYLAGAYSIADMAVFPWLRSWERQGQNLDDHPNLKRWFEAINARPAVKKGLELLADKRRTGPIDDKAREILFGATQYAQR
jgi:GST-like protein